MDNTNFFVELLARFFSAKPKFFKYLQAISGAVAALAGLILILSNNGVVIPVWLEWLNTKAALVGGIVAAIISQLPKKDPNTP